MRCVIRHVSPFAARCEEEATHVAYTALDMWPCCAIHATAVATRAGRENYYDIRDAGWYAKVSTLDEYYLCRAERELCR